MNELYTTKVLPALSGKRKGRVLSYEQVTNSNGGYLAVQFQLEDRVYQYNIFPGKGENTGKQVNYITTAIRKQLGKDNEGLSLIEVLDLAKETDIDIWFAYNMVYQTMNVAFHNPEANIIGIEDIA